MLTGNGRYAGDAAWNEWFEICSVAGCDAAHAARLREEITSAMYAQLFRYGFSRADAGEDDPVAFFDSYFRLRGSRDRPKPLKAYFRQRIAEEDLELVDFVCGTLFGSGSGRIRDIVIDWISVLKGWKPRTVTGEDGHRRLQWENAGRETLAASERASDPQSVEFLDEEPYRRLARGLVRTLARRLSADVCAVALAVYATAYGISLAEPAVLSAIGLGKSQAYAFRERLRQAMARELRGREDAGSPLFGRILLETCAALLPDGLRRMLGVEP